MKRLHLFIGSSTLALPIAKTLKPLLKDFDVHIWNEDIFKITGITIKSLVEELGRADFAILILTPDDLILTRKKKEYVPRDNVIFELGLFMGSLGEDRTIMLHSSRKQPKLPSDLLGVTTARYQQPPNWKKVTGKRQWKSVLTDASVKIGEHCRKLGPRTRVKVGSFPSLKIHTFREGTVGFRNFFAKWYSQPGELRIFCNDLKWVEPKGSRMITEKLMAKVEAKQLKLYLRDSDAIGETLKSLGAVLFSVKKTNLDRYRLSLIIDQDAAEKRLIIRHKDHSKKKIVFAETTESENPYLVYLAEDMLEGCYDPR